METLEAAVAELNDRELAIMLTQTEELVHLLRTELEKRQKETKK